MKLISKYGFYSLLIASVLGLLYSCDQKEDIDTTPPGSLVVKDIIPTNGGAKITYTLPADDDILFVKASYTNSLGEEVFKVNSLYTDTLEIDGFNDTEAHTIQLYVVDRADNHSQPVATQVTPLISFIYLVQESLDITASLGGVKIHWENESEKTVHIYLKIATESFEDSVILSSSSREYNVDVYGLDSIPYDFFAKVEDFAGNQTSQKFITQAKPMFEQKIDKESWTLVSELSVNGDAYEGLTVNFWDDVIDTPESPDDNSYFIMNRDDNGGALSYPMDIVIDLHKQVIMNRFIVWQRAFYYEQRTEEGVSEVPYYYQSENLRMFDIFISNDLTEWSLAGSFDIGDPKDEDGNVPDEDLQEAANGHMFMLEQNTEPFRYLKFSITSNFGSEIYLTGSEITLFGLDNVGE